MESITKKDLSGLRHSCIEAQPRFYDFSTQPYDYDGDAVGWRVASFSSARDRWAEKACEAESKTLPCGSVVEAPIDRDGDIGVTWGADVEDETLDSPATVWFKECAFVVEVGKTAWYEPGDDEYPALCALLGIPDAPEDDEDSEEEFHPVMNFIYPLNGHPGEDWPDLVTCTTVVMVNGEYCLALTAGGMNLTWEIVESYVNLGYLPPAALCDLPRMAGRGDSEKDQLLAEASRMSCEALMNRLRMQIERIDYAAQR